MHKFFILKSKSFYIIALVLLIVVLFCLNIAIGYQKFSISEVLGFYHANSPAHDIVMNIRLPRIITAMLVGMSLPVAGMMLQTMFNNPIADSSVLGVSSMAGLGNALLIFLGDFFVAEGIVTNSWLAILFGSIGAVVGLLAISGISYKLANNASVLVVGLIFSSLASALIGMFQYFSSSEKIKDFLLWSMGSLDSLSWEKILAFATTVLICLLVSILTLKQLNILLLGEKYAETMGVKVSNFRRMIILITGVLTATVTVFVGPIAFLGFFIPHIARSIFRTTNHNWLFPANILIGISFLLIINLLQIVLPIVPINVLMSIIGAPMVIGVIIKQSKFM